MNSSDSKAREAFEAVREALPEFSQQDDYLLAHGASLMSEDSHEIMHVDTVRKIVAAALQWAASQQAAEPQHVSSEWRPCRKLPVTVHVREQRTGEQHISTREGITPVKPDDLIMRGVQGEEYPIGRELFEKTYELLPAPPSTQGGADA